MVVHVVRGLKDRIRRTGPAAVASGRSCSMDEHMTNGTTRR
jgi:hypothetical protein